MRIRYSLGDMVVYEDVQRVVLHKTDRKNENILCIVRFGSEEEIPIIRYKGPTEKVSNLVNLLDHGFIDADSIVLHKKGRTSPDNNFKGLFR